jgi:hypothetical protein
LFESNDFADLFSLKDGDKVWLQWVFVLMIWTVLKLI